MEYYKAELFSDQFQKQAELFKALSHPARIAILQFLAQAESCYSGDITKELPLSRTTVSQHLTALKKIGLIKGTINGAKTNYCINQSVLQAIESEAKQIFNLLKSCKNTTC